MKRAIADHEKRLDGHDDDVSAIYNAVRDVGQHITDAMEEKHARVRETLDSMLTRLGGVEGELRRINGGSES